MTMNSVPKVANPATPAAPATGTPGRKAEVNAAVDPAFAALLAMMMGAPVPAQGESPEGQPETAAAVAGVAGVLPLSAAAAGDAAAATGAVPPQVVPQSPALMPTLEQFLLGQRSPATTALAGEQPVASGPSGDQVDSLPEGVWLVEPLPPQATVPAGAGVAAKASPTAPAQGLPPAPVVVTQIVDAAPRTTEETAAPDVTPGDAFSAAPARHTGAAELVDHPPVDAPAPLPSPIDVDRLMDAIARTAVSSRDGRYTVTLRLHPEHLGEVRLQLQVVGREVQTVLQVANPEAKQLLEQRGDQLRQGLDQAGLSLAGFHVSTGQGDRSPRERDQEWQDLRRERRRNDGTPAPAQLGQAAATRRGTRVRNGGLDTMA